jgi:ligand-binding SRPBCC domain-containing protein
MEMIRFATWINAPVERCYKLSLSIDLHVVLAQANGEVVASTVKTGLLGLDQGMTLHGKRFGMEFRHTSVVNACRPPMYFREVMVDGLFERFEHDHHFALMNDGTRMRDEVRFAVPLGPLGFVAERVVLRRHLIRLLKQRNMLLKAVAESEDWRHYLEDAPRVVVPPATPPRIPSEGVGPTRGPRREVPGGAYTLPPTA